jgi:hypothetical protein
MAEEHDRVFAAARDGQACLAIVVVGYGTSGAEAFAGFGYSVEFWEYKIAQDVHQFSHANLARGAGTSGSGSSHGLACSQVTACLVYC